MIPQVFFRKLFSPQHHERWQNRQFTSFTPHGPPFDWQEIAAAGSTNPADYPLETASGVSLPAARDLYIDLCAGHPEAWDDLDEGHQWTIQELGTRSPMSAITYAGFDSMTDRLKSQLRLQVTDAAVAAHPDSKMLNPTDGKFIDLDTSPHRPDPDLPGPARFGHDELSDQRGGNQVGTWLYRRLHDSVPG